MDKKNDPAENETKVLVPCSYIPWHPSEEDEIDLRDLWNVLVKRKSVIFAVMAVAILLSLAYVFTAKPVYQAKAMLQIGSINSKPVENAGDLKTKLSVIYHVNDKNIRHEYPYISAISVPKNSDSLLELTVRGLDNQSAEQKLESVSHEIGKKYKNIIQGYIQLEMRYLEKRKNEAERLRKQIAQLANVLDDQKDLLRKLNEESSTQKASAISMEYSKNLEKLSMLQGLLSTTMESVNSIELSLSPVNIRNTELVGEIVTYDHPVKPRKKLIIALAVVAGGMLGVFFAFWVEFINRREED
jgi:uncharacterized protein involved in exopolysaccharide biosynthesis